MNCQRNHNRSRNIACNAMLTMALTMAISSRAHAISGGAPATDRSYSFIVKLDIGGVRACTGALVKPRWVVTAASCFTFGDQPARFGPPPRPTTAIVGRPDLTQSGGQVVDVVELVPQASRNLVLAKLATAIDGLTPVPIATTPPVVGESVRVAGYGRTSSEWIPNQLQIASFTVESADAGSLSLVGTAQPRTNTCKGDSGGPTLRERNGQLELVAVSNSSWQSGCLGETETRVGATQARVDDLAGWITDQPTANRNHGSIQWAQSGRCLDVQGNTKNKDPLQLRDCLSLADAPQSAHDHQRWFFVNAAGVFKHRTDDHRKEPYLDFPLGSPAGTQLEIYEPSGLDSQRWSLSGGALINGVPGDVAGVSCLEVPNAKLVEGTRLAFSRCNGTASQKFVLPGDGTVRPAGAIDLCMDNYGNTRVDGNPIVLWHCNANAAQRWDLFKQGLANDLSLEKGDAAGSIQCLDRPRGGGDGSLAQLWNCNGWTNQYFEYLGSIHSAQDNCMAVRDGGGNGAIVEGTACTSLPDQVFYYTP